MREIHDAGRARHTSLADGNDLEIHPLRRQQEFRTRVCAGTGPQQEKETLGIEVRADHKVRPDLGVDFIEAPRDFRRVGEMAGRPVVNRRVIDEKDGCVSVMGTVHALIVIFRLSSQKADVVAVTLQQGGQALELRADAPVVERHQFAGYDEDSFFLHLKE